MAANTLYRNKSGGRENCWEVTVVPGAAGMGEGDECLFQYGFREGGKKRLDAGYILRVKPRGFRQIGCPKTENKSSETGLQLGVLSRGKDEFFFLFF